jgi:hypothetical protein
MTTLDSAQETAQQVIEAIVIGQVIAYASGMADKEYPEISWAIFGLPITGEIAVLARVGDLRLGRAAPSPLLIPKMSERVFGIDLADHDLAMQLSGELWEELSPRLIAAALRQRGQ